MKNKCDKSLEHQKTYLKLGLNMPPSKFLQVYTQFNVLFTIDQSLKLSQVTCLLNLMIFV